MKRGKPMRRGAPLRSKTQLRRGKRVKPRNAKRAVKRKAEAFGPQAELCRTLPCCVCGREPSGDEYTHPHHEGHSRGAGGKDSECLPLCAWCHTRRHATGRLTFWSEEDIDPATIIAALRARVAREAA